MLSRQSLALTVLLAASCSSETQTSLRLTVHLDAALGIDQLRVTLSPVDGDRLVPEQPAAINDGYRLVLLVPDDWADTSVDVTLAGLASGKEVARGQISATPRRAEVVDLEVTLTAPCISTCTAGETRCEKAQLRFCQKDARGCATFSPPEPCPAAKPVCSNDACAAKCSDVCTSGSRRCRDGGYQVCGRSDAGCLDWGPVLGCSSKETCRASDGLCVLDCGGKPCACQPGEIQACQDLGECKGGVRKCVAGAFGDCEWQVGKQPEVCDGKDNDCSGTADDNLVAPACAKKDGVCQGAVQKCGGAAGWLGCSDADYQSFASGKGLVFEAVETRCDKQDNDCNGKTDEPASCCQPVCSGKACGASDTCGGKCQGTCGANATCVAGSCVCDVLTCGTLCCAAGQVCTGTTCTTSSGPTVSTLAGSGTKGFANGPAASAQFNQPVSVAVDGAGTVFVADMLNERVRAIANGQVTTFAGSGLATYGDGAAASAGFYYPAGVAVDGGGNVFVADLFNQRIRLVAAGQVSTLAGDGTKGFFDGPSLVAMFNGPFGVAVDGTGQVFVADQSNQRIRLYANGLVSTLAGSTQGFADGAAASARFSIPAGVAVDGSGNVFVADVGNNRIRKVAGGQVSTLAGSTSGFADGPAAVARFAGPQGVAVDASGRVYVADWGNHRVRVIANGQVSTLAGTGTAGFADGPAASAQFAAPFGVAVDGSGKVYVADRDNARIRVITP